MKAGQVGSHVGRKAKGHRPTFAATRLARKDQQQREAKKRAALEAQDVERGPVGPVDASVLIGGAAHNKRARLLLASAAKIRAALTLARSHPGHYIEFAFRTPKGERIELQPFHWEWLHYFMTSRRAQIEASKSHGKTTLVLGFLTWAIGNNPNIRIKLFAQSEPKARERISVLSEMIERNKLTQLVFPTLRPDPKGVWSKLALTVERDIVDKEATVSATGIMGTVEGGRSDLVVFDDICLAEGTPIVTMRGLLPIELVEPGDWVRNHEGTWSRVGEVIKRKVDQLVGIKAAGHNDVFYTTPGHPAYALRELQRIASGKYTKPAFHRVADFWASKTRLRWLLLHPAPEEPVNAIDWNALWTEVELPPGARGQHCSAGRTIQPLLDPNFWWLIGLWLAGGWTEAQKVGTGKAYRTCFALGGTETHLVDRLRGIAESLLNRKLIVNPYKGKDALRVSISDKALHSFVASFCRDDGLKECPWWIYDLPLPCAKALLAGHWMGDGSLTSTVFKSASVSHPLLVQLRALLARAGVTASIGAESWRELSSKPIRELSIDRSFAEKVLGRNDFSAPEYTWSKILHEELARPIQQLEELHGDFTVFNLRMDIGPHSYESPGLVSHNCDYRTSLLFPQHRDAIKKKVYAEILPMLESDGRAISIATPHHKSDAVASLRANRAWEAYSYPVGTPSDPYAPLWPDRWPREALIALQREVGAAEYDRAYRLKEISHVSVIVKPEQIQYYTADMLSDPWQLFCVTSYDLALGHSRKAAFFACVIFLADLDTGNIFVADAYQDKIGFVEQAEAIVRDAAKWQAQAIAIEETGYQSALREYLMETAVEPLPIHPIAPGAKSKELRLMETTPYFQTGKIFFNPRLDPSANPEVSATGDLVTQLLDFANSEFKDLGDAFSQGIGLVKQILQSNRDADDDWTEGQNVTTRLSVL